MHRSILALVAVLSIVSGAAQAQGSADIGLVENEAAYIARCRNETIANYPAALAQADSICQSNWTQIVVAGPMANAILTVAPRQGVAFDPASVRVALSSVRWAASPDQGTVVSGRLGDVDVAARRMPAPGVTFQWFKNGETIPFNLEEGLRVRGAALTLIACQAFGAAEDTRIYRVAASGKSPFMLTIGRREAAVASQSSDFSASSDFSGQVPSLAALRRDGSEWQPTCP